MKKLLKGFFDALCKRSTKPDITSYKWARREPSIFASSLLWTIWFFRVLSLYQHVKVGYRALAQWRKFGYTENASGRPDVPPWLGEVYFLLFTLVFSVTHHFQVSNKFLQILVMYYLFESSLWILYYTVFRRFFELGYTIYHQLEYITTIILIIPTQAVCFAHLYSISFREALAGLLGSGGDNTPLLITVCSYLLSAIVIGMIISNFPGENVKKCGKKAKMLVIGCGDVVKSRLYPALNCSDYTVEVSAYDLETVSPEDRLPVCQYLETPQQVVTKLNKDLSNNSIIWVETPPQSHLFYMEQGLKTKARLVVVEKPIATKPEDLEKVKALLAKSKNSNRLFFLSYYILEKALPLTYLATLAQGDKPRCSAYAKYLQIENAPLVNKWHKLLGKQVCADVCIFEGADQRKWVADHKTGGHLFETFVHNVLIAANFCGPVSKWKVTEFSDADYTQYVHEIRMEASCDGVGIHLHMKKNCDTPQRGATLVFENGRIVADFNEKTAEIFFDQLKTSAKLQITEEYSHNYGVLTDLVGRVFSGEYAAQAVDGFKNQPEVLQWLCQRQKEHTSQITG